MHIEEKTLELISLSLIQQIFENHNVKLDLINEIKKHNDKLFGIDIYSVVKACNDYFKFHIENYKDDTPYSWYLTINQINEEYKKNIMYETPNLENKIGTMSNILIVKNILENECFFQKFINNQEKKFYEYDVDKLVLEIKKYYLMIKKSNIVSDKLTNRYNKILLSKDKEILEEYKTYSNFESINPNIECKILCSVDLRNDDLTIAREIYLLLARNFRYSMELLFYDKSTKEKETIYNKNISKITFKSDEITCFSWAKMYVCLLSKVGIDAVVSGGYHKYVVFKTNNFLIKADATNHESSNEIIKTNDLVNAKIDLPLVGFTSLNNDLDFSDKLSKSDEIIRYKKYSTSFLVDTFKNIYEISKSLSVAEKIEILNKLYTGDLKDIELMCYYYTIVQKMFCNSEFVFSLDLILEKKLKKNIGAVCIVAGEFSSVFIKISNDNIKLITELEYIKLIGTKNILSTKNKKRKENNGYARIFRKISKLENKNL